MHKPLLNLLNFVTYILVITAYHFTIGHLVKKEKNPLLIIILLIKSNKHFQRTKVSSSEEFFH